MKLIFTLILTIGLLGVDRSRVPPMTFTTKVLRINRDNGQMILEYSPGGKQQVAAGRVLNLTLYESDAALVAQITKVHDKNPWAIVQVTSGAYKELEKGFKFKTKVAEPAQLKETDKKKKKKATTSPDATPAAPPRSTPSSTPSPASSPL